MSLLFSDKIAIYPGIANEVIVRSAKLGTDPDWFMFLSDFESGLDPYRENSYGCFSWIQFCPDFSGGDYKTIKGTKYYFADLKNYTPLQLLDLSFDYLEEMQSAKGRFADYHDMYFAILWPEAYGKTDDYVLNNQTNTIFDLNKDGKITVGEVKDYLDARVKEIVPSANWNTFFKKKTFCSSIREKSLLEA